MKQCTFLVLALITIILPYSLTHATSPTWTPQTKAFEDGVTMVMVPPGCFTQGSTPAQIEAGFQACQEANGTCYRGFFEFEGPSRDHCFTEPFWIDQTEVTNAQFDALGGVAERPSYLPDPDLPRTTLSWIEARDFCALRGARLPTEAEWEYAARGPENRIYPWGDPFVADNVVYVENSDLQPAAVGSRPDGASWVGALDMSGNVAEWVNTATLKSQLHPDVINENDPQAESIPPILLVVHGGSFGDGAFDVRAARRFWNAATVVSLRVGFRCARS